MLYTFANSIILPFHIQCIPYYDINFTPQDQTTPNMPVKDPFNLSNDEYYNPKLLESALKGTMGSSLIQVFVCIYILCFHSHL